MTYQPLPHQRQAIDFALNRLLAEKGAGLFLDPGLGKTGATLSILRTLQAFGEVTKTLLIAPPRVCHSVWRQENEKFNFGFNVSLVAGSEAERMAALSTDSDIYLMSPASGQTRELKDGSGRNPMGLNWLLAQPNRPRFDCLVIDESTEFRNWSSQRMKSIKKLLKTGIRKRLILTGTPAPNSMADLFSQIYILDDGERLGKAIKYFRKHFMREENRGRYRKWTFRDEKAEALRDQIADMVVTMSAEDHLDLPDMVYNDVWADLPPTVAKAYKDIETELFAALDNGDELIADSAAAKYTLCRQIANGGAYQTGFDEFERQTVHVHNAKAEALAGLINELNGQPLLVAYQFQHDLDRIKTVAPKKTAYIHGGISAKDSAKLIDKFADGKLRVLVAQCQALNYGVDRLQKHCRHAAWFGLTDQPLIYTQFNKRLHRLGQSGSVIVHRILARATIDEAIAERLEAKGESQAALLAALKSYRNRRMELEA